MLENVWKSLNKDFNNAYATAQTDFRRQEYGIARSNTCGPTVGFPLISRKNQD